MFILIICIVAAVFSVFLNVRSDYIRKEMFRCYEKDPTFLERLPPDWTLFFMIWVWRLDRYVIETNV